MFTIKLQMILRIVIHYINLRLRTAYIHAIRLMMLRKFFVVLNAAQSRVRFCKISSVATDLFKRCSMTTSAWGPVVL